MSAVLSAPRRFWQLDIASRAAVLSFVSNSLLMVSKITVGLVFGSVAVLSDGIDSAQDVFASGLAFFAVRMAIRPADEEHPYGHGKTESLAALSQAALIAAATGFILFTATRRLLADETEVVVAPSLAMMVITVAANLSVAAYAMRAARISGSVAIKSDARHLLTNVVQATGVIIALVLVQVTGNNVFDPLVAMAIGLYIGWIAVRIFRDALSELIDTALPEEELAVLDQCLNDGHHGVRGYHALRTRKSGREKYIDMHILLDPQMTVSDAHREIERIERHIKASIPGAVIAIHVDPDEPDIMDRVKASENDPEPGLHLHRH